LFTEDTSRPKEVVWISVVPGNASSGHALHVCAAARPRASCQCRWGGRLLRCGAGVRWAKLDLAWEFRSPGHVVPVIRKQPAFFHVCLEGTVRMLCAVCVHWGGRQLSSAPVCVGPSWPGGLVRRVAWERCGENGRQCWGRGRGRGGGLTHFNPPGCYLFRRDGMSRPLFFEHLVQHKSARAFVL
jgi:hypothetical protein